MNKLAVSNNIRRALTFSTQQTTVYVSGDNGTFQVGEDHNYEILTTGQYSGTSAITLNGLTDTHSNECVLDRASGLMWSRTPSASVGPSSVGTLPWNTNVSGEGIFPFASAANSALLAGHGNDANPLLNWRIPNKKEVFNLDYSETGFLLDPTAFPLIGAINIWTSSTQKNVSNNATQFSALTGQAGGNAKTALFYVLLVRGPVR